MGRMKNLEQDKTAVKLSETPRLFLAVFVCLKAFMIKQEPGW